MKKTLWGIGLLVVLMAIGSSMMVSDEVEKANVAFAAGDTSSACIHLNSAKYWAIDQKKVEEARAIKLRMTKECPWPWN